MTDLYRETGSESIRQYISQLEIEAEEYCETKGSPELYRDCLKFIHEYLVKVVI